MRAHRHRLPRADRVLFRDYPRRSILGFSMMVTPGVPLQRDLLHLCAGARQFYGVSESARFTFSRSRSATCSDRCCSGTCSTLSAAQDDLGHLRAVGSAAGRARRSCSTLACSTRSPRPIAGASSSSSHRPAQRRLPHGERDLPAGAAGEGDLGLLRHRPMLSGPSVRSSTARSSVMAPSPSCCSWATCSVRQ